MWRNLKLLHTWRYFRFLHNHHAWKAEISPHGKFFSTSLASEAIDKYEVWPDIDILRLDINILRLDIDILRPVSIF